MNDLYFGPAIATFELPLPPGINSSYGIGKSRTTGNPRIVSNEQHKQFKRDAALLANNQLQLMDKPNRSAYERAIEQINKYRLFIFLEVLFFLEDILSRDEDGGLKVVQDVVCQCIGINDKYVLGAHLCKRKSNSNSRCEIAVYIANQENAL